MFWERCCFDWKERHEFKKVNMLVSLVHGVLADYLWLIYKRSPKFVLTFKDLKQEEMIFSLS